MTSHGPRHRAPAWDKSCHDGTPHGPRHSALALATLLAIMATRLAFARADAQYQAIRKVRGYTYEDEIDIHKDRLPGYEAKLKIFFEEHIHADEEIRYVLDGSGYFDVRDAEDRWIRISCQKGDMIVLPAGIWHRFTLDEGNYIKAKRLFVGEPVWTPLNRSDNYDSHPARVAYVQGLTVA